MTFNVVCETWMDLLLLKIPHLLTLHPFGLVLSPLGQKSSFAIWRSAKNNLSAQSWGSKVLPLQSFGPWAVRGWAEGR